MNNTGNSTSTDTSTTPAATTTAANPTASAEGSSGNALYERLKKCPDASIFQAAIPSCLVGTYSGTDVLTGVACSSTLAADGTVTHVNGTIRPPAFKIQTGSYTKQTLPTAIGLGYSGEEHRFGTPGYVQGLNAAFNLDVQLQAQGTSISNPHVDVTQEYSMNDNKQLEATCRVPLR